MAARSLWRSRARLLVVGSAVCGGSGAAFIASSEDPSKTLKLCTNIPVRLFRNTVTAASIAFDYEYSLSGLAEGSNERAKVKHEVHLRSAQKLQELCFKNGGIYIKLGQHIGQLDYLVPEEYVHTMRQSMLNKCPVSSYEQVCEVFKKEVGETPDKVFAEFDPVPIASASLAQVHIARTHTGEKVAVKVQHSHLTDTAAADTAAVGVIVNTLHRIFPSFDYRWLLDEMSESLPKELDFMVEAKNNEKCLDNFRKLSPHIAEYVYAPTIYWNLSSSKLLTMEFMDGAQVNDVAKLKKLGIQPYEVSKLLIGMAKYYDIDDILTEEEFAPVLFHKAVNGVTVDPSSETNSVEQGAKVELPFWLAHELHLRQVVSINLPSCFDQKTRLEIQADAACVDLRSRCPYFYEFGCKLQPLVADRTIGILLSTAFKIRYKERLTKVYTAAHITASTFLPLLTKEETNLYEEAHLSMTAFKKWRTGGPRFQIASILGRKRKESY